jgi:hypothetical protein
MRFSIRDLLLVTVIVALAVGWGVDRSRLAKENDRLEFREQLRNAPKKPYEPTPWRESESEEGLYLNR